MTVSDVASGTIAVCADRRSESGTKKEGQLVDRKSDRDWCTYPDSMARAEVMLERVEYSFGPGGCGFESCRGRRSFAVIAGKTPRAPVRLAVPLRAEDGDTAWKARCRSSAARITPPGAPRRADGRIVSQHSSVCGDATSDHAARADRSRMCFTARELGCSARRASRLVRRRPPDDRRLRRVAPPTTPPRAAASALARPA